MLIVRPSLSQSVSHPKDGSRSLAPYAGQLEPGNCPRAALGWDGRLPQSRAGLRSAGPPADDTQFHLLGNWAKTESSSVVNYLGHKLWSAPQPVAIKWLFSFDHSVTFNQDPNGGGCKRRQSGAQREALSYAECHFPLVAMGMDTLMGGKETFGERLPNI